RSAAPPVADRPRGLLLPGGAMERGDPGLDESPAASPGESQRKTATCARLYCGGAARDGGAAVEGRRKPSRSGRLSLGTDRRLVLIARRFHRRAARLGAGAGSGHAVFRAVAGALAGKQASVSPGRGGEVKSRLFCVFGWCWLAVGHLPGQSVLGIISGRVT